jgi:WD40 repeat protein
VAFSPREPLLATGSIDGTIKLWHTASGQLRTTLSGHQTWVNGVAFSPNGAILLSGSSDGTLRVWTTQPAALKRILPVSSAEVRSIAWSPDGKQVAAGLRYGTIRIWNAANWDVRHSFRAHGGDVWSLAFTADSKRLVSGDGDWNRPGLVKIWDATTARPLGKLQHTGEVLSLATSAKGALVAAGGADGVTRIWDIAAPSAE